MGECSVYRFARFFKHHRTDLPKQVLAILNEYFSEKHSFIEKHEGVVLEYICDAMMIVFGAPNEVEDHQVKAVECTMEISLHAKLLAELIL